MNTYTMYIKETWDTKRGWEKQTAGGGKGQTQYTAEKDINVKSFAIFMTSLNNLASSNMRVTKIMITCISNGYGEKWIVFLILFLVKKIII